MPLLEVDYINSVKITVTDIMHFLFGGIGKHLFKYQHHELKLFTSDDLKKIDAMCTDMNSTLSNSWSPKNIGTNAGLWMRGRRSF